MTVHSDHPFATPMDQRDPVRRLRGRLAAPVTIFAAGNESDRAGITISSVMVIEGEEPRVAGLVGTGSDFVERAEELGVFTVHVLADHPRGIADVFAGLRPSPGGVFASVEVEQTRWGPHLTEVADWAGCRLEEVRPLGEQQLVVGVIEHVEVTDLTDPLVYFRGTYRSLDR